MGGSAFMPRSRPGARLARTRRGSGIGRDAAGALPECDRGVTAVGPDHRRDRVARTSPRHPWGSAEASERMAGSATAAYVASRGSVVVRISRSFSISASGSSPSTSTSSSAASTSSSATSGRSSSATTGAGGRYGRLAWTAVGTRLADAVGAACWAPHFGHVAGDLFRS